MYMCQQRVDAAVTMAGPDIDSGNAYDTPTNEDREEACHA